MSYRFIPAAFALAIAITGCTTATEDDSPTRRGAIGKADLVGSCVDTSCDGPAPSGNCWCDDLCADYGDCCDDKATTCDLIQCGGFAGLPCPDGLVCVDNPADSCDPASGGADCGGMCVEPLQHCGGFTGLLCDEGEYCHFELDQTCGFADQTGVCKPSPDFCIELFAPVCGCNGETYGNECKANAAGTSKAAAGECAPPAGSACETEGGFCTSGSICPADTVVLDASCDGSVPGGTCCKAWMLPPPPAPASCVDHCGGAAGDTSCWCDDQCEAFGDCCDDFAAACS